VVARKRYARRRIERYILTIAGLIPETTDYRTLIKQVFAMLPDKASRVMATPGKSHVLLGVTDRKKSVGLRFGSFQPGDQPDVVNIRSIEVKPSPLSETEANLIYTHALFTPIPHGARLTIEMNRRGIYPSAMEEYLQWLLHEALVNRGLQPPQPEAAVSITAETREDFVHELESLTRIQKVSVRLPKTNPSWYDNDAPLAKEAGESNAAWVEVTMAALRGRTLEMAQGIVETVKKLRAEHKPLRTKIYGERNGEPVPPLDSEKNAIHDLANVQLDEHGQVREDDILGALENLQEKDVPTDEPPIEDQNV